MARPQCDETDQSTDDQTCCIETPQRSRNPTFFRLTVEPALLLLTIAITLTGPVLQNLVVSRICKHELGYNATVCRDLQQYPEAEQEAQPKAAVLFMAKQLIEAIVPALLSFFVGPWSDVYGRKPLLMVPLGGHVVFYLGLMMFSFDFASNWDVHWILLPSVILSFSGGFVALATGAFCLVTDISSADERAWRMGVAEAAMLIGLPVGLASSSFVLAWAGYPAVFGISALFTLLAYLYVWRFVPETITRPLDEMSPSRNMVSTLFDRNLIADMVRTCIKPRPGWRRATIFLVMAALASTFLTFDGEISVMYLYTREKFEWSLREYSLFSSASVCIITAGTLVGLHTLSKQLALPDAPLAAFAFLTKAVSVTTKALAPKPWVLYLGSAFDFLGGVASPLGRTILSKSVPKEDIGKVFSLASSLDALTPIAASPLYTLVYNETFHVMPGAFFLVSAVIFVIDIVLLSIVSVIHYKFPDSSNYVLVSQESAAIQ